MIFGRREKRPALLTFDRILVPLAGTDADDSALRLTAILLAGTPGQAFLLHVTGRHGFLHEVGTGSQIVKRV